MTKSSLPTRPTAVLESLLSWRFPSLRYFCIGTFLSGPFFGTFWGLFITFNQGLEIWNFLFSGLSFQKSHVPLLSCLFAQVLTLFKKLELGDVTREMSSSEVGLRVFKVYHVFQDFLGSIKDVNMKEIIAKESLEYQVTSPWTILGMSSQKQKYVSRNGGSIHSKMFSNFNHCNLFPQPSKSSSESMVAQRAAVGQLVELGHSVFHKFGRLQVKKIMRMVVRMILMRSLAGCRQGHSPQDQSCPCYFVRLQNEGVCIL